MSLEEVCLPTTSATDPLRVPDNDISSPTAPQGQSSQTEQGTTRSDNKCLSCDEDVSPQPCDASVVERDHCYESMSRSQWNNIPHGPWLEDSQSNASDNSDDDDGSTTKSPSYKQKFIGHRNARTMIKEAVFWGNDYILSGSDCGHVFGWERETARLVMLLEADHHVVNCVQPHPTLPLLATSGIDYDVKLWSPTHDQSAFNSDMAQELMKRNAVMLEETKDTITVPASFMIRMLACLSQIRRGRRARFQRRGDLPENSQE